MSDGAPADDATDDATDGRSPGGGPVGGRSPARRAARAGLSLAGVLLIYYAVPVDQFPSRWDLLLASAGLFAGLTALVWVTVRQLRAMSHVPPGDPSARLDVLGLVAVVVVPLFALVYYALEQAADHQFADLATKTDALYFALSTLATVGFGDVHATAQLSRALVTLQMAFDLVFVAALASILTTHLRARAGRR